MKNKSCVYIPLFIIVSTLGILNVQAYTDSELNGANFIAQKGYIVNNQDNTAEYRLDDSISRKEFMKVAANLSGKTVTDTCLNTFSDVANDWGCKYIEFGLQQGFLASNPTFRPDENISKLESIKLVFKSRGLERTHDELSWQEDYIQTAVDNKLISSTNFDYNTSATRGFIFEISARSFSDFSSNSTSTSSNRTSTTSSNTLGSSGGNITKTVSDSGELDGTYQEYYPNGQLKFEANYREGLLYGENNGYYDDGSKNFESTYKNNLLDGLFIKYYKNGEVSQEETYQKGKLTGYSYFYDESGTLIKTREYIGGFLLKEF